MRNSQGDHPWPQILLIATALVFVSCNGGGSVSADDAYLYSSPPPPPTPVYEPPYVYKSPPPPPYMSTHLHHHHTFMYSSPPPPVKSPPLPYNYNSAITGSGVVSASDDTPTYCVAKPDGVVDQNVLLDALNWVCGKVDCSLLLQGQRCYEPDTVSAHASYAFNEYYYQSGRLTGTCDFNGTAMVTTTDPSHDTCTFRRGRHQSAPTVSLGWSLPVSGTGAVLLVVMTSILF